MAKHLKEYQCAQIISLLDEGFDIDYISTKFDIHRTTVMRIKKRFDETNDFSHRGGNGRPSKNSLALSGLIKGINKKEPKNSLRKIAKAIEKRSNVSISHASIRNYLNDMNKFAYSAINKPRLSKRNIKLRFELSRTILKTNFEQIKNIIFSDESKFEVFSTNRSTCVWREPGRGLEEQFLNHTVKYGGASVMVWGCFSYYGVGKLVFIDGIMDAAKYVSILSDNLIDSRNMLGIQNMIFQQDNDPKHTSRLAREYLMENNIQTLKWPAQSPDMNPIENLWAIVKRKVEVLQPKSKNELKEAIIQAWSEITPEITMKLVFSFKKRARQLYNVEGHHISY